MIATNQLKTKCGTNFQTYLHIWQTYLRQSQHYIGKMNQSQNLYKHGTSMFQQNKHLKNTIHTEVSFIGINEWMHSASGK